MTDLTNPAVIKIKGGLFLVVGGSGGGNGEWQRPLDMLGVTPGELRGG